MSSIETCPFCGIEDREGRIINSNELMLSFLSNPRLVEGHGLVVPRRHVEDPRDLTDEEILAIFAEIKRIETKMVESGMCTGCDIRQHFRPFLTQGRLKVDHVHFHILPRTFGDKMYSEVLHTEDKLFATLDELEKEKLLKILGEQYA